MKKLLKAVAALGVCAAATHASALVLPNINNMSAGQYGDFIVYSLDLLAQCKAASDPRCIPFVADPPQLDAVDSSPGKIAQNIIVYAAGSGNLLLNYAGPSGPFAGGNPATVQVDNNFEPPTGNATSFDMSPNNEPTEPGGNNPDVAWTGDTAGRWDAKLSTIVSFLNGADLVFLFDNNQEGGDSPQYFWAKLDIKDANGNVIKSYCLNSNHTFGVFDANSNACSTPFTEFTDALNTGSFVSSGGEFCVDKVSGATVIPPGGATKNSCAAANAYFIDNNLGQNTAEFAVLSQDLNANLLNWASLGYFMSIDFKMRGLNDGGEQLWIAGIPRPNIGTPEPGTLALAALAILLTAAGVRRRQG